MIYDTFKTGMIGKKLSIKLINRETDELDSTSVGRLAVYSLNEKLAMWTFEHQPDAGRVSLVTYRLEITVYE